VIRDYFLNLRTNSNNFRIDLADGQVTPFSHNTPDWRVSLIETGETTSTGARLRMAAHYVEAITSLQLTAMVFQTWISGHRSIFIWNKAEPAPLRRSDHRRARRAGRGRVGCNALCREAGVNRGMDQRRLFRLQHPSDPRTAGSPGSVLETDVLPDLSAQGSYRVSGTRILAMHGYGAGVGGLEQDLERGDATMENLVAPWATQKRSPLRRKRHQRIGACLWVRAHDALQVDRYCRSYRH